MSGFTFHFPYFPTHRIDPTARLRLATVSFLALSSALTAGSAWADCSTDGLAKTCSGTLGVVNFTDASTTSDETASLTIENATNLGFTNTQTNNNAIWMLNVGAPEYSQAPAGAVLDIDLDGFLLVTNRGPGAEVLSTGSVGQTHGKSKGSGKHEGKPGGAGGAGGQVTATIAGLNVNAAAEAILISSSGAAGGDGAEGHSTGFGRGYGGDGGVGGDGGAVTVTLTDRALSLGTGLVVESTGGNGGDGGVGMAADYSAHGGDGGNGGQGGDVIVQVADLTSTNGNTGIVAVSHGGQGGEGGVGENTLTSTGDGGAGGVGGAGGSVLVSNTTPGGTGTL